MEKGQTVKKKRNMNDTEEEKNPFSKLPSDILLDIFSRIPAKSLFDSRWVCKSWLNLVHDPRLAKMHLTRASQNKNPSIIFETYGKLYLLDNIEESNVPIMLKFPFMGSDPNFSLVGSCNGLVCVKDFYDNHSIYIFNPVTGEYIKLPEPNIKPIIHDSQFGFSYHPPSNEYKVLRLVSAYGRQKAEIYTLSSNSWRKIKSTKIGCYGLSYSIENGAIHWSDSPTISFDVGEEEFRVVEHPAELPPRIPWYSIDLGVLGGCLSLFYRYPCHQNIFVVWVMKQYGVKESWTKQFVIEQTELLESGLYYLRPLCILNNGKFILAHEERLLVSYDPQSKMCMDVEIHGFPIDPLHLDAYQSIAHVASLVSLRTNIGRVEGQQ